MVQKVLQLLAPQEVGYASCPRMTYKLYALSHDRQGTVEKDTLVRRFRIDVLCSSGSGALAYTFELAVSSTKVRWGVTGTDIEGFLESVHLAGADLSGTDLEYHARCIECSYKMLTLLGNAVEP